MGNGEQEGLRNKAKQILKKEWTKREKINLKIENFNENVKYLCEVKMFMISRNLITFYFIDLNLFAWARSVRYFY